MDPLLDAGKINQIGSVMIHDLNQLEWGDTYVHKLKGKKISSVAFCWLVIWIASRLAWPPASHSLPDINSIFKYGLPSSFSVPGMRIIRIITSVDKTTAMIVSQCATLITSFWYLQPGFLLVVVSCHGTIFHFWGGSHRIRWIQCTFSHLRNGEWQSWVRWLKQTTNSLKGSYLCSHGWLNPCTRRKEQRHSVKENS